MRDAVPSRAHSSTSIGPVSSSVRVGRVADAEAFRPERPAVRAPMLPRDMLERDPLGDRRVRRLLHRGIGGNLVGDAVGRDRSFPSSSSTSADHSANASRLSSPSIPRRRIDEDNTVGVPNLIDSAPRVPDLNLPPALRADSVGSSAECVASFSQPASSNTMQVAGRAAGRLPRAGHEPEPRPGRNVNPGRTRCSGSSRPLLQLRACFTTSAANRNASLRLPTCGREQDVRLAELEQAEQTAHEQTRRLAVLSRLDDRVLRSTPTPLARAQHRVEDQPLVLVERDTDPFRERNSGRPDE